MNLNQLVGMLGKLLMKRFMGAAVNKGLDLALGPQKEKSEMNGDERARHKASKEQAKRLRQTVKVGRKLW
ncbi:MAG: hypothetical protein RIR62_547 [Pseudomonadota bacterium]|jgi:hypothetical protein